MLCTNNEDNIRVLERVFYTSAPVVTWYDAPTRHENRDSARKSLTNPLLDDSCDVGVNRGVADKDLETHVAIMASEAKYYKLYPYAKVTSVARNVRWIREREREDVGSSLYISKFEAAAMAGELKVL